MSWSEREILRWSLNDSGFEDSVFHVSCLSWVWLLCNSCQMRIKVRRRVERREKWFHDSWMISFDVKRTVTRQKKEGEQSSLSVIEENIPFVSVINCSLSSSVSLGRSCFLYTLYTHFISLSPTFPYWCMLIIFFTHITLSSSLFSPNPTKDSFTHLFTDVTFFNHKVFLSLCFENFLSR
jgi:hypothetical protein